ncbi:MAG: NADH-quinone oxidoreductase subunit M [Ktedonobacteraceae bacterium]|nr:NADH-quinone oxidoreductase subunit M [Ktedonobacteraceae bacterium]
MFPLLSVITFLPLLGGIALLFFRKNWVGPIRWTALSLAGVNLLLALLLMLLYGQVNLNTSSQDSFHFNERVTWISALGVNYSLGVDGISMLLVVLTALLTFVCILASFNIERKVKNYMAFMLLLDCGITGVFLSTNLFLFYVFWEVMLIPAYFLVGSWGEERRIYAAFKFVLYTSVGSLLMLAGIIALGYYHQLAAGGGYTLELHTLLTTKLDSSVQFWLLLAFAAAFSVKIPFVPFHSWLPDTYSQAPVPVTVMLAGAMTKAGAYGFLRFCIPLFPQAIQALAPLFNALAIISILYCALLALVQTDMKRLLGYSSISHLGVVMLGIFAFNAQGVEGSVLQMVNHGITTAALFLIVGFIEARTGTRRIADFGGLATRVPILATVMLIAALSSLGLPGLNSFAGEFLVLLGTFRNSVLLGTLGTAVVVPAAWYLIRFFQGVIQGAGKADGPVGSLLCKGTLRDLNVRELLSLSPLLALIFYIGLQPAPLTSLLEPSVVSTMQALGSVFVK